MGALDTRYQRLFAEAEQSANPILNATCEHGDATLSAQLHYVLVGHVVDGHGTARTRDMAAVHSRVGTQVDEPLRRVVAAFPFIPA